LGEFLIHSTAVVAVAGYAGRVWIDLCGLRDDRWQRWARWFWTLGGMMLSGHTACAFHFQHHWSHAAAWEHVRQRTLELTGWNSGGGLYADYAVAAIWLIDVLGWWTRLDWPRKHRAWFWTVQLFLVFMMVNATAVFGPRYWIAITTAVVIAIVALRTRQRLRIE
jgi:hypothetical protein